MKNEVVSDKKGQFALGVDLGGTNIKVALVNYLGEIINKIEIPTEAHLGWEAVLNRIYHGIHQVINNTNLTLNDIVGIGMGVPGLPDFTTGMVLWGPNIGWENVPAGPWLSAKLAIPIYIDNDGNTAAYGEYWAGRGKGAQNMVAVTIGTGIGAGLIIDGRIFRGSKGAAGELGHMIILPQGPQCNCGRKGCLETLTSATSIAKSAKSAIEAGKTTILANFSEVTAKTVFQAAKEGDKIANEIVDKTAYYLGIGLANVINLLNPDLILIGGGVSRGGSIIMEPLRRYTLEHSLPTAGQQVQIDIAQLGNDAGAVGAAGIAFAENLHK